jgi:hypothetical protein
MQEHASSRHYRTEGNFKTTVLVNKVRERKDFTAKSPKSVPADILNFTIRETDCENNAVGAGGSEFGFVISLPLVYVNYSTE